MHAALPPTMDVSDSESEGSDSEDKGDNIDEAVPQVTLEGDVRLPKHAGACPYLCVVILFC